MSWRKPTTFGLSFGLTLITISWVGSHLTLSPRVRAWLLGIFAADCVLEPHHRVDYEIANYYTSTHPHSPFVGRPVVMRTAGGARHNLAGRELTTTRPNGSRHQRMLAAGELGDVLGEVFGIALPPDDLVRLTAETEKGK